MMIPFTSHFFRISWETSNRATSTTNWNIQNLRWIINSFQSSSTLQRTPIPGVWSAGLPPQPPGESPMRWGTDLPLQATYAMQDRGGKRWQADGLVFETDLQLNTAWQIGSKLRVGLKIIGSQIKKCHMIAHVFYKYVKMFHVFMFKSFIFFYYCTAVYIIYIFFLHRSEVRICINGWRMRDKSTSKRVLPTSPGGN